MNNQSDPGQPSSIPISSLLHTEQSEDPKTNAGKIDAFKSTGRFDEVRDRLLNKYKQSEASKILEQAVRQQTQRMVQMNPDLQSNPQAQKEAFDNIKQLLRMKTIDGTIETNAFIEQEIQELKKELESELKE